ncbi:NTP transferase domain-containing protein [Candidatus Woesearchaeota archaeon]|nr:NTP transferase domain-containing protein [Candidatus Woesearchaeota archaeon]
MGRNKKIKVIIPLAGKGTRLRPHTYSKPKPLLHVAGKPVLGHILDSIKNLDVEEVIMITGDMEEQIREYVDNNYDYKTAYFKQTEMLGDGHAISMAKDEVRDTDVLIIFSDTLFVKNIKTDIDEIKDYDGIVWANKTDTPERFGILNTKEETITEIEEKPEKPKSDLAIIGLYYFKSSKQMFSYLEKAMNERRTSKGEYRLADAMALMVEENHKLRAVPIGDWLDTGIPETMLSTNKYLLENGHNKTIKTNNSIIIEPVYIEDGCVINSSVIGPHVSIAKNSTVENSIIKNSIIGEESRIQNAQLTNSLIGDCAEVIEKEKSLNIASNTIIR